MSARGLLLALACVAAAVWGLVLLAWLMRPIVMVPTDGPPLFGACRLDSTGAPRLVWFQVQLDS